MKLNQSLSKTIVAVSRYLLAILFIFSGGAKAINPFGLSNQIGEYFNVMGLDFLFGSQLVWAVLLPAFEILLGLALMFGMWRKLVAWAVLVMMALFTVFTLWIAIANPVSDCGCFGEVFKISNWETFLKNVAFTIFALIFFTSRNWSTLKIGNFYTITLAVTSFLVPFYFMWTVPPFEATNYKVGNNLIDLLETNEEIVTLPILTPTWEDRNSSFINDSTKTLLIVSPKLEGLNVLQMKDLVQNATNNKVIVILLTSAPIEQASKIADQLGIDAYNSDLTVLKTLVQNFQGGAIYIANGVIEDKWAMSKLPKTI